MEKIFNVLYLCARKATLLIASVFIITGLISLWSEMSLAEKSFVSYDLVKYRPSKEINGKPDLKAISDVNPDVVAWLTIYGTNIDYPVLQGSTDMEYINKDVYGNHSISGSIFLSVINSKDFFEPYQLIYGHNMENGSMFGDLDKFTDESFFNNCNGERCKSEEGILITGNDIFDLRVLALLKTDAFDPLIYGAVKTDAELKENLDYIRERAVFSKLSAEEDHVLALTTCDGGHSYGRLVLICGLTERTEPLNVKGEEKTTTGIVVQEHPKTDDGFAILNFAVLLLTVYLAFPLHIMKKIFTEDNLSVNNISLLILGISIAVFVITENIKNPLTAVDYYTPVMISMAALIWMIRYHKKKKKMKSLISDERIYNE